jgi:hypothetical protein
MGTFVGFNILGKGLFTIEKKYKSSYKIQSNVICLRATFCTFHSVVDDIVKTL